MLGTRSAVELDRERFPLDLVVEDGEVRRAAAVEGVEEGPDRPLRSSSLAFRALRLAFFDLGPPSEVDPVVLVSAEDMAEAIILLLPPTDFLFIVIAVGGP